MNRKYITAAVVVLLGVAAVAYSNGWFNSPTDVLDAEITSVSAEGTLDQANMEDSAAKVAK